MNAISTFKVYLMMKSTPSSGGSAVYEKLVDIKDFPDLGGSPETLETTTLSDPMQTYIMGIQSAEALEFNTNYNPTDFITLDALKGETHEFAVWFGASESSGVYTPDGSKGKWQFSGELSVRVTGGGVNEVVGMAITIAPSTEIKWVSPE